MALKNNEVPLHATTWMNLGNVVIRSQSLIRVHLHAMSQIVKFIVTKVE